MSLLAKITLDFTAKTLVANTHKDLKALSKAYILMASFNKISMFFKEDYDLISFGTLMAFFNKIPMFSKEEYDDWKIRMQAQLAAQDDDMGYIITDGPMKILKVNTAAATIEGAPLVEKHISEWTTEDKKKVNLDNIAKDVLYKTLDKNIFAKIKNCTTAKEIWEKLTQLCEGNDQTKENKLTVAIQKFDTANMKPVETLAEFYERFSGIIIELISLGKDYSNREIALKLMRAGKDRLVGDKCLEGGVE